MRAFLTSSSRTVSLRAPIFHVGDDDKEDDDDDEEDELEDDESVSEPVSAPWDVGATADFPLSRCVEECFPRPIEWLEIK